MSICQPTKAEIKCKEDDIAYGEHQQILNGADIFFLQEFEGNQAGHGGNKCAEAAQINADQQVCRIIGEAGEQNGGGHIGEYLAGQNRGDDLVAADRPVEKIRN